MDFDENVFLSLVSGKKISRNKNIIWKFIQRSSVWILLDTIDHGPFSITTPKSNLLSQLHISIFCFFLRFSLWAIFMWWSWWNGSIARWMWMMAILTLRWCHQQWCRLCMINFLWSTIWMILCGGLHRFINGNHFLWCGQCLMANFLWSYNRF